MNRFTTQEKTVLIVVFSLLLLGLAVKTYRTAHPSAREFSATPLPSGEQVKK